MCVCVCVSDLARVWPFFYSCRFSTLPGSVQPPGWPGPGLTHRAGLGLIIVPRCCTTNICMFLCFYVFIPLFCNESWIIFGDYIRFILFYNFHYICAYLLISLYYIFVDAKGGQNRYELNHCKKGELQFNNIYIYLIIQFYLIHLDNAKLFKCFLNIALPKIEGDMYFIISCILIVIIKMGEIVDL